jgi:hypothetical protein
LNEDGETVNSTDDKFVQPSDEDAQGNVLTDEELTRKRMSDVHQTPSKEDSKPAAQPEHEDSSPSPEQHRERLNKRDHESENIKKLFANLAENTPKQLKEQGEKHAMEIAAMKRANMDTPIILTTKTTPAQTMNNHRSTAHFNAMTRPSDTMFDGRPKNWPAFEHHLLTEAENPTISWNQDITNYQPNEDSEPFNFLERYVDLPGDMTNTLMSELADAKQINLVQPASQLLKLHCLKTKVKKCLTTDLAHDLDASMPTGLSHKDRRLFFIKLVSHTFPDKEAHKRIIYQYIFKLEITESNNMESFTRELRRHIKQYDAIQGSEWKKITNHIIRQYQKIDFPPFNTGFNMIIVRGPSTADTKYGWLCILLEWTNSTRHDLTTHNLWPKPEITTNQELNTMPMHDKQWGTDLNSWKAHGMAAKSKTLAELTTPISIFTAATMDQSTISYNPYLSTHVFTKANIDAPKPTYTIWIGVSHVFLSTFWCSKCNSWSSHHDKIHDECIRWQNMKDAQVAKQVEYRKETQQSHYGPPQLQDRTYGRNDNNK